MMRGYYSKFPTLVGAKSTVGPAQQTFRPDIKADRAATCCRVGPPGRFHDIG